MVSRYICRAQGLDWNKIRLAMGRMKAKADYNAIVSIKALAERHETAAILSDIIQNDGGGTWPPRANYDDKTWPAPLRPFKQIYNEMAPLMPNSTPSLDHNANISRINHFRSTFRTKLHERVNLNEVKEVLLAVNYDKRCGVLPCPIYNPFYWTIATCRHAYRWAIIPVVRAARVENTVELPPELVDTWDILQRHFGCTSQSGNNTSNLVLNFDEDGNHMFKINTSLSKLVTTTEEAFSQIFREVEVLALPMYLDIVQSIIAFAHADLPTCAHHVTRLNSQLRPLLRQYYERMHEPVISPSVWLSHVQGFFAWGVGHLDEDGSGEWKKYDGLSGNQVLLFIVLDAFIGIPPYLDSESLKRNVPRRQRALADAVGRHSFRHRLGEMGGGEVQWIIQRELLDIIKQLKLFRTVHRYRARVYLSQPAPERLPMTSGKSLLKDDVETSLEFLDTFMLGRRAQTK